jgi:hypothetical protein
MIDIFSSRTFSDSRSAFRTISSSSDVWCFIASA